MADCLKIADTLAERDQDALLNRMDELERQGLPPDRAALQAANDLLAAVRSERQAIGPAAGVFTAKPDRNSAAVNLPLARWARDVWDGKRSQIHNAVLAEKIPHDAMLMGPKWVSFGRNQPLVLPDHVVFHMKKRHAQDGLTPDDVARIPEGLSRPRAVVFDKTGEMRVYIPAIDKKGSPLVVALKKDEITGPRGGLRVTRIATLYGEDNSLMRLAKEMQQGSRVWMPSGELQHARDLLAGLNRPSPGSRQTSNAPGPSGKPESATQRDAAAASVLSDAALAKFRAGDKTWETTTESVEVPTNLASVRGIAFSRRGDVTETPEFKRWFGDSKVVDEAGRPLVVYHGTGHDITEFTPSENGEWGRGTYLTNLPDAAGKYAVARAASGGSPNVIPAYVALRNPAGQRAADIARRHSQQLLIDGQIDVEQRGAEMQRILREQGYDGVLVRGKNGNAEVVAFNPEQIKSAIGNAGTFDPSNPSIIASRRQGRFNLRDFGLKDQTIEALQDRYNRWLQAVDDIRSQGGVVNEANDFYRAEERYWGIVGAQIEDFGQDVERFVEAVAADGLQLDDVALYAYAQHAAERNAYIASIRPSMPDGGSGMTNQDAADILDEARQAGLEPELQRHAQALRDMIQGTRDLLFQRGLINQDEYDAWNQMFTHYVPLRGLEGVADPRGTGQGFNIRGKEGKSAMGRKSQAKQIIEQVIQDRTRSIIRAGKNEVLRSFLAFVLDNPSPNLWEVNAIRTKPVSTVDANGNRVIDDRQEIVSDDTTVTVKDGGEEIHILVHDQRLREQLQNLNADNPGVVVGAFLAINRALSMLYTSLSPVFTVLNGARDFTAATIGAIDELGFMGVPRLWAAMPKAIYEAYAAEMGAPTPDYQLYRNSGGKTGFFDFKTLDKQTQALQSMVADAERSMLDPRRFGKAALELIEGMNAGIENATRLASFKAALASGKTVAQAASISKNITVNFNRRGTLTPALSAWFLFFNPAVQGTARVVQAVRDPRVLSVLGMGMVGLFALAMRNAAMGDDDDGVAWWDKVPDEVKERNVIVMLPPGASAGDQVPGSRIGRYVKIPMPYGYNFFAVVANQAADAWRHSQDPRRGRSAIEGAGKAFTAFMGAWLPVQELGRSLESPKTAVLAAVPDALNPVAQVLINTNSFGRDMRPEDQHSRYLPDATKFFPGQAGSLFQLAADRMNRATGGDAFRSGWIDVSPSTIESLVRGYGGGPATFGLDLINAFYLRQTIARDAPRYEALPFAKQLYGVIDAETDRLVGYQRLEQAAKVVEPFVAAQRQGGADARSSIAAMREESGPMLRLASVIEGTREQLSQIRKKELSIVASTQKTEAEKFAELMAQADRRRLVLHRFSAAYDRAIVAQDAAKQRESTPAPQ